jgi:AAA family ATP:ADP antiporter
MRLPFLPRALDVRGGEGTALALSFVCAFTLLAASFVLRPIRDALGIEGGVHTLPWLFTGTFVVTLTMYPVLGAIATRSNRTRFAFAVFSIIAVSLLVFRVLLGTDIEEVLLGRAFFVWVSVFNVILVSVFWGVMADVFTNEQGRRLFGAIAAGGTAGAMIGPLLTRGLVYAFGVEGMLLVAAGLIGIALICVGRLARLRRVRGAPTQQGSGPDEPADPVIGGQVLDGLSRVAASPYLRTISVYILLLTATATFVYFQQAWIVDREFSSRADRTAFFAVAEMATQGLALLVQLFLTRRLIRRFGVAVVLAVLPIATALGFAVMAAFPVLAAVAIFQVVRRASDFALARPTREILFTVVDRKDKFKAKNVVDVVVYRGSDAAFAWADVALKTAGLGVGATAVVAIPLCGLWTFVAAALGRMEARRRRAAELEETPA